MTRSPRITILICAALLFAFAALSYTAALSKSATYDEPLHAVGAWLHLWKHDFRVNPEDPPLWHYWAAMANPPSSFRVDLDSQRYANVSDDVYNEWPFVVYTLYRTEGNDADRFVNRSRFMMLLVGLGLGAMIGWWSYRLGASYGTSGVVAAAVAVGAFAFDPNFLAHASLVKNDVSLSLVMLGCAYAVWRGGQRLTWKNTLAIAALCAVALCIKYSALLIGPIVAMLLLIRAVMPEPWLAWGKLKTLRSERVVVALVTCVIVASITYVGIWACYGFRFRPAPEPGSRLNVQRMLEYIAYNEMLAKSGDPTLKPTTEQAMQWRPGAFTRVLLTLDKHRLLPQAWIVGLLYTYQSALVRQTFLLGQHSIVGWWYYFPIAMLVKSPIALIFSAVVSLALALILLARRWRQRATRKRTFDFAKIWTVLCLLVPPGVYLASAMRSNLNLGLRHVLPVYPFLYIGIGLAAAYGWKHRIGLTRLLIAVFAVGLLAESLAAFPDYIAFFNVAAGGSRGGLDLLGDSNLDWGQDLKLVAQWQQDHPNVNLYLCYFGTADPWAYGIRYTNFPGGYAFGPEFKVPTDPGILAVSATQLQGIYGNEILRAAFNGLRQTKPVAVLGGTIYLYNWPPRGAELQAPMTKPQ